MWVLLNNFNNIIWLHDLYTYGCVCAGLSSAIESCLPLDGQLASLGYREVSAFCRTSHTLALGELVLSGLYVCVYLSPFPPRTTRSFRFSSSPIYPLFASFFFHETTHTCAISIDLSLYVFDEIVSGEENMIS